MKIQKVINNNVVSAHDDNNQEVVIMGRGIGYKAQVGDLLDHEKIEKIFRMDNHTVAKQFQEVLANMPLEHMKLSTDIIAFAKENLNLNLNQSIYVTLTDHINFAIERFNQGIFLTNALLWEIRQFYRQEFLLGQHAVSLIQERLGIQFTDEEAGFIALHIVNAEYSTQIGDTFALTKMIQGILQIVKRELVIELDEESLHYERFITHLKFLCQRVYRKELLKDEEVEFARLMKGKYPEEYACGLKIAEYIEKESGEQISGEEIMYISIHIKRVRMKDKKAE